MLRIGLNGVKPVCRVCEVIPAVLKKIHEDETREYFSVVSLHFRD